MNRFLYDRDHRLEKVNHEWNSYSLLKCLLVPSLNRIAKEQLTAETKLEFSISLTIS